MLKQLNLTMDEDEFLHQNKADIMDIIDGCLLDNELYAGKNGYILLREKYVNEWTSRHAVYFARYNNETAVNDLWEMWDKIANV